MRPRLTEREKEREICIAGETNFEILTVRALLAKYAFEHDAQTDKKTYAAVTVAVILALYRAARERARGREKEGKIQ